MNNTKMNTIDIIGEIIETPVSSLWMGTDGICRIIIKKDAEISIDEMNDSVSARNQLIGDNKVPV